MRLARAINIAHRLLEPHQTEYVHAEYVHEAILAFPCHLGEYTTALQIFHYGTLKQHTLQTLVATQSVAVNF